MQEGGKEEKLPMDGGRRKRSRNRSRKSNGGMKKRTMGRKYHGGMDDDEYLSKKFRQMGLTGFEPVQKKARVRSPQIISGKNKRDHDSNTRSNKKARVHHPIQNIIMPVENAFPRSSPQSPHTSLPRSSPTRSPPSSPQFPQMSIPRIPRKTQRTTNTPSPSNKRPRVGPNLIFPNTQPTRKRKVSNHSSSPTTNQRQRT